MKKMIVIFIVIVSAFGLFACAQDKAEPQIVNTFEESLTYYEMSDGTWKTDDYTYKYRL